MTAIEDNLFEDHSSAAAQTLSTVLRKIQYQEASLRALTHTQFTFLFTIHHEGLQGAVSPCPGAFLRFALKRFYLPPAPANDPNITELTTGYNLDEQYTGSPDPQELTFDDGWLPSSRRRWK
jgi:hypothetical protein